VTAAERRRLRWHERTKSFTIEGSHARPRTFYRKATMIQGSYRIPDSAYREVVYVQPPPRSAYNNRFLNINPSDRFVHNFRRSDPISGTHSHYWSKLGDYVHISAQTRSIHIRFQKKTIPARAIKILISRLIEHAHSNQVLNPRLFNVQTRGGKRILSKMIGSDEFQTADSDYISRVFRKGMKLSKHFILKQDNVGGIFHDRVSNDDLLL